MHKPDNTLVKSSAKPSENKQDALNADFVKLVTNNYGMYIKKCYSYLKCTNLAEDAVQEGILAAHSNLTTVQDRTYLAAWLYRIIIRKAIDSLRKNKNFPILGEDLEELVTYDKHGLLNAPMWAKVSNPEEEILKAEGLSRVKEAIEGLPNAYRIPLSLRDIEGFSLKEIAALLEISESNVKIRIHRGRLKLRSKVSDYFFPSERENLK